MKKDSKFSNSEITKVSKTLTSCRTKSHLSSIRDKFKITELNLFSVLMDNLDMFLNKSHFKISIIRTQSMYSNKCLILSIEELKEDLEIHWIPKMKISRISKITRIWKPKQLLVKWLLDLEELIKLESVPKWSIKKKSKQKAKGVSNKFLAILISMKRKKFP